MPHLTLLTWLAFQTIFSTGSVVTPVQLIYPGGYLTITVPVPGASANPANTAAIYPVPISYLGANLFVAGYLDGQDTIWIYICNGGAQPMKNKVMTIYWTVSSPPPTPAPGAGAAPLAAPPAP
jgi:hypothetical protein